MVGMRLATIPHSHPRWLVAGMLAALVLVVLNGFDLARSQPGLGMPSSGHAAVHDWLLVVNNPADRFTVYDAVNGRPLQQLDTDATAAMLARHDGRVFVIAGDDTRNEPTLPPSPRIAASGR
jgi:hypothetical protein